MTPTVFFTVIALDLIVPGLAMIVGAGVWSERLSRPVPAFLAGLGAFLGALGTGICLDTLVRQRGLTDWTEASSPVLSVLLIIVVAGLVGGLAAVVARDLPFNENAWSSLPRSTGSRPRWTSPKRNERCSSRPSAPRG